jgi:hypothetical protein
MYEIHLQSQNAYFDLVFEFKYSFPLISFVFLGDSTLVALGTCDGKVLLVDMAKAPSSDSPNFRVLNEMNNPISKLFYLSEFTSLICVDTCRTVHLINLNTMNVEEQYVASGDIQDCDLKYPNFVLALSDSKLEFLNPRSLKR